MIYSILTLLHCTGNKSVFSLLLAVIRVFLKRSGLFIVVKNEATVSKNVTLAKDIFELLGVQRVIDHCAIDLKCDWALAHEIPSNAWLSPRKDLLVRCSTLPYLKSLSHYDCQGVHINVFDPLCSLGIKQQKNRQHCFPGEFNSIQVYLGSGYLSLCTSHWPRIQQKQHAHSAGRGGEYCELSSSWLMTV